MRELIDNLIIYRSVKNDLLLSKLANLIAIFENEKSINNELLKNYVLDFINELIEIASTYNFSGNLWVCYLAYLLATTENAFTISSEKRGFINSNINDFVINDFEIFYKLINYDFAPIEKQLDIKYFSMIQNYHSSIDTSAKSNCVTANICTRINELSNYINSAKNKNDLYKKVIGFYKEYGVGKFGLNLAFRITAYKNDELITPITETSNVSFDDLVGYESQKEELKNNTIAFLEGKPANNVLLYGDTGTGKSTSIKALLNLYYNKGLRMIEVYKQDFKFIPEIIDIIKNRNYKFIIFMDDLSFESAETEYKYLKAIIEGDLGEKPDNVLIYATSNRRHLIRETFSDRKGIETNDVNAWDTMAERISLSNRFGVSIAYYLPERKEFFDIVLKLARQHPEIKQTDEELIKEADLWQKWHGTMSGRLARQFVDHLLGTN